MDEKKNRKSRQKNIFIIGKKRVWGFFHCKTDFAHTHLTIKISYKFEKKLAIFFCYDSHDAFSKQNKKHLSIRLLALSILWEIIRNKVIKNHLIFIRLYFIWCFMTRHVFVGHIKLLLETNSVIKILI